MKSFFYPPPHILFTSPIPRGKNYHEFIVSPYIYIYRFLCMNMISGKNMVLFHVIFIKTHTNHTILYIHHFDTTCFLSLLFITSYSYQYSSVVLNLCCAIGPFGSLLKLTDSFSEYIWKISLMKYIGLQELSCNKA